MKKIHPTSMLALACVLGVGVMLSGLACGVLWPWPGQECLTDADCPDGYTCQNGVCVETPAPECTTDADCPDGYTCQNGVCVETPAPECTTDADCPDGYTCQSGVCVETPAPECTIDADCPQGQICQNGVCVTAPVEESPYETHKFDHNFHMTMGCESCHHEGNVGCDTSGCHTNEWIGGVPPLKEAMHDPDGGCRQCHTGTTADGLWDCTKCHTALLEL